MRKLICVLLLGVIMTIASAYAEELEMTYDNSDLTYTVSGKTEKRKAVTLRVLYLGEEEENFPFDIENMPTSAEEYKQYLSYIDVIKTDKSGEYTFLCKMSSPSGYYYFSLTDEYGNQKSKLVEWLSPTYKEEKLVLLNEYIEAEDADGVAVFLKKYQKGYGYGDEYFNKYIESDALKISELIIKGGKIKDVGSIGNSVVQSIIFTAFEKGETENVLEFYKSVLELDVLPAYETTLRDELSSKMKKDLYEDISKIEFCGFDKLREEIVKIVVLKGIEISSDWGTVQNILETNADVLSENAKKAYSNLKKKYPSYYSDVAKALKGKKIEDFNSLSKKIIEEAENAIDSVSSSGNSSGGGSGGSGGGSSGGSKKSSSSAVVISGGTDIVPETKKTESTDVVTETKKTGFTDLDSAKWAEEAIIALSEKGIVSGRDEEHFDPNAPIKREEFLSIIVRAFNLTAEGAECDFDDVDKNAWYYPSVASGYYNKITSGIDANRFGLGMNITRQDLCVLAYNAAVKSGMTLEGDSTADFKDYDSISDYAKNAVTAMAGCKIVSGMENGEFMPKNTATRAQTALIVYRLING